MSENWIDQSWKNVIKENVDDAISFFMPGLAAERDYTKKPESADPVHETIGGISNQGSRISDVCLALPLKTGDVPRAMFLIEQQHRTDGKEFDSDFGLRMFQSFYRASDEFKVPVTSLAIFTGQSGLVDNYSWSWQGTSVNFGFNAYSVAKANAEELRQDERIFALLVLAGKRMLDADGKAAKREEYSLELLDLLKSRGLNEEKSWSFKRFIYRVLQIGKEDIAPKVKEVWKMQFRPIDEVVRDIYIGYAKEEGIEKGKIEVARNLLSDGMPLDVVARNTGLPLSDIQLLSK
jgi:hypothetical protein